MSARQICWLTVLMLAACSHAPEIRYYTLSAEPVAKPIAASVSGRWVVDAVAIPDLLDRPQIVLHSGANQVDVLNDDRWAAPLADMIQRVVAANLSSRLGSQAVSDPGLPSSGAARGIGISILELTAGHDEQCVLDASWEIARTDSGEINRSAAHRGHYIAATHGTGPTQIVSTMSHLLGAFADDIAETLLNDK